jgi:hypothetical protein
MEGRVVLPANAAQAAMRLTKRDRDIFMSA